jgi:hypothetical protein
MSDAFEKWAADKSFMLRVSAGDGYVTVKEMALEAWQAALQSGEPVAVADRGVLNWIDGKQFNREADLYTTPQPVVDVNQQLLNDIINMLIAVKGAIKLGRDADACNYINAAIAAAQENNK